MKKKNIIMSLLLALLLSTLPVFAANFSYNVTGMSVNYSDNPSEVSIRSTVGLRQSTPYGACAGYNHGGYNREDCSAFKTNGVAAKYVWWAAQTHYDNHVHFIMDNNYSVSMIR